MVPVMSLWLPIILSAAIVFLASFVLHMVMPHHRSDFAKVPAEDETMEALRKFNLAPGEYLMPRPGGPSDMKNPAFIEKRTKGPVVLMTVFRSGPPTMGAQLAQWFVFCLLVGVFAAYVTGRAVGSGTPYLTVYRFAGATAFACYTMALWQDSIWYKRKWSTTLKSTLDGLLYALLTGGTFGWLWPH